ncbi:MAG: YidC/Oxa1 family membrane protein insertase [Atopobiaceae bacterium]
MWDWFINWMTSILAGIESFCGDWGLAVIILTVIIRLLIMPLMTKSTASSAKMQALQPKMQEIQEKYQDDPQRMQEEMQKFYSENKFNPLGGCLPIIIQMPVFFALFTVAKNVPSDASFYGILPSISISPSQAVADYGWIGGGLPYVLFVAAFGVLTLLPMLMNAKNMPEEQRSQNLIMAIVMAVMMVWFGWTVPAAVLLYYDASAIWQVAQQKFVTQKVMDKVKAEQAAKLEAQGRVIEVERREQKKRQHKKN